MCQHWGAGDPSESTQILTGRGIWVRKLFWAWSRPQRMGCSTFHGLDERVGAGEKKCTRAPNTEPTVWTVSALKTSQANLLGLTFRAPYALVPFVLASWSKFSLQRCFSQLTPCWCLPLSKFSINISSLFLHTSFNTLPSPLHSIPLMLLPLPHLPIELGQSEPPSCKTPVLKAKKKQKREGGKSWVKPQSLLCNAGPIT